MRIGVLTAGGDCPGLNAVIRAVVRTAFVARGTEPLEIVGIRNGFHGLVTGNHLPLTLENVRGILPRGGTILGASNRDDPFSFPTLDDNGQYIRVDRSADAIENARRWGLSALIVIGGDGSLTVGSKLNAAGLPVIGVPKTIDNDLSGTDQTFGFDTALHTVTDALDKLHTTAESHHRVMVVEVMGRYAGWIPLHAGLSGGANVILLPEMPFDLEAVCHHIRQRVKAGRSSSIVVVSEGAHPIGGDVVISRLVPNSVEQKRLGGIGQVVGEAIENRTGIETRVTVLGHVQRGGSPSAYDRILGTRLGARALQCAMAGETGIMVSLRGDRVVTVPLAQAIEPRRVTADDELVQVAKAIGVSLGQP